MKRLTSESEVGTSSLEQEGISLRQRIKNTGRFFCYVVDRWDETSVENGRSSMGPFEAAAFCARVALSPTLRGAWVKDFNSEMYGMSLLREVFPNDLNPGEFHSRGGVVNLSDRPVQVLGWDEYGALVQKGVSMGFDQNLIEAGFEREAERRGIDPEFHFFEAPPLD